MIIIEFLLKALVVCGFFLALIYAVQRGMMYFPDKTLPVIPPEFAGQVESVQTVTADGLKVSSWWTPPDKDMPIIMFFHGNAGHYGHRVWQTTPYRRAGFGVLLVGYRGYGGNPGKPTEQGFYKDADAWMDWILAQGFEAQDIVIYGQSIGSGPATALALQRDARALILEAPFTSAVDLGKQRYPILPIGMLMKDRFENLSKIDRINMPLLIMHGDRDRIVPYEMGQKLFERASEPKNFVTISGYSHNDMPIEYIYQSVETYLIQRDK